MKVGVSHNGVPRGTGRSGGRPLSAASLLRGALALLLVTAATASAQMEDPAEIWRHVNVYRDEWGVPHVYADSVRAMAFGFGYAQAQDHLEGMLLAYRMAEGRLAAVLGKTYASSDEFALKMGYGDMATRAIAGADPVTKDLCEGFALGVNAYLVDAPRPIPEWVEGVKSSSILALLHCYLMGFAPFDLPDMYHHPRPADSGNAWAVGPERSQTGDAMLVINPHSHYSGLFRWCEAHLMAPDINVAGATLFGLPAIVQGHNGILGWALTPNEADFADVYLEPRPTWHSDPKSIGAPRLGEQLQALLLSRTEPKEYYVLGPNGPEQRVAERFDTPRGPVMGQRGGRFCTYQVGGLRDFGALRQLFEMGRAQSLDEFRSALAMHQLPCFHVVYADRDGNIFYLYNAKMGYKRVVAEPQPEQPLPFQEPEFPSSGWDRPVPGDNPSYEWGDLIAVDLLPVVVNPPSGYLQACGNPPWTATGGSGLRPEDWPAWFSPDADTYRARRARHLLSLGVRSFTDLQAMVYDVLVPFSLSAVPQLLEYADQYADRVRNAHPDLAVGLEVLDDWNYVAELNSHGMTFFHVWWATCRQLAPAFPTETDLLDAFADGEVGADVALEAADSAARLMRNEYQSLAVPWGEVHTLRRGEREVRVPGAASGDPLFVMSDTVFENGRWHVTYGHGYAMVVKFGELVEAVSMSPFGASEDPDSPHFDDQLDLLAERRFKLTRFHLDDVQNHAESALSALVFLRAPGMQGTFTLRAERPIEARLATAVEAPGPLPPGLDTYSVFVQPEYRPPGTAVTVDVETHVPIELCPQERFEELAVYAHEPGQGWHRVQLQHANPQTRTLSARARGAQTYAVLGPVSAGDTPIPSAGEDSPPLLPAVPGSDAQAVDAPDGVPELPPIVYPPISEIPPEESLEEPGVVAPDQPGDAGPQQPPGVAGPIKGAIGWGRTVELTPPGVRGVVRIVADKPIGARLIVSSDAPAPLPPGLAAFAPLVSVDCSSPGQVSQLFVNLAAADGVCAASNASKLGIYAYDDANGWTRFPEQEYDAATGVHTAVDDSPRTYALLGPQELLVSGGGS